MISSHLDYCNALTYGIPDSQVQRFQSIQNNAARIVGKVKMFDHITPTLTELHWLPEKERIHFIFMVLTYKALNGKVTSLSDGTAYTPLHTPFHLKTNAF